MARAGVVIALDLLRHGEAHPVAPGATDADRVLSAFGKEQLAGVLRQAKEAGAKPALILSSPYARAIESAEMAAETLGYTGMIVRTRALEPPASPFDAWDAVRGRAGDGEVLLVGHQPLLGDLVALLARESVKIGPGTLLRIDVPDLVAEPAGKVRWVLRP